MRREFSAGGVLVRRLRGRWVVAAIRPGGQAGRALGAAEGADRPRRGSGEATALREVAEETGARGRLAREARRRPLRLHVGRRARSSRSSASTSSATGAAGSATSPRRSGTRSPRRAGCRSTRRRDCSPTAASGRWRRRRLARSPRRGRMIRRPVPSYALNFYSPIVGRPAALAPQDGDDPARRQVARSTRRG